jgi:hypothetical protein
LWLVFAENLLPLFASLKPRGGFMGESRERFVHLAESRTKKAIKDIRLIGNLSNRSNYSYTEEDVAKIFKALESELRAARKRFADSSRSSASIEFKI